MRCIWLSLIAVAGALLLEPAANAEASEQPQAKTGSVTVFPVAISSEQELPIGVRKGIAEVIGMLLERTGLEEVELAEATFSLPESDNVDQVAAAFGRFVTQKPIKTDYTLLAHLAGTPGQGVERIETILVDRRGNVVMADRDDSKTYARTSDLEPKDPMTASIFVARKLQRLWDLPDPLRKDAPTGDLNAAWRAKSGLPTDEEIAAMERRAAEMKSKLAECRIAVYPVRVGASGDADCAARLARGLSDAGIGAAVPADLDPGIEIQGSYNEQKVLWQTARGFRRFLQSHPPAADYALLAHYAIAAPGTPEAKVGAVHVIVCDREGRWVLVDFQNSHHPDFQQIAPKSADDCNRLVVRRIEKRLDRLRESSTQ